MNVQVNVTVELGPVTLGLLTNGAAALGKATAPVKELPAKEDKPAAPVKTIPPAAEKPAKTTKPAAEDFEALDDDAKLEAIKTEVTKHTKKGKSGDIKALLTHFGAGRASELSTEVYGDFYAAIKRYGAGETIEAIIGGGDDLS